MRVDQKGVLDEQHARKLTDVNVRSIRLVRHAQKTVVCQGGPEMYSVDLESRIAVEKSDGLCA